MKKLMMFAATMTIVSGAFAQCGDPTEKDCAMAYDVKMSVRTTVGGAKAGYTKGGPCGDSNTVASACYRKIGKQTLQGVMWTCVCDCEAIQDAEFYLWNKKAKVYEGGALAWDFINIIGKAQKDAEASWALAFDGTGSMGAGTIYGAGFGKYDAKRKTVKTLSGNFAGFLEAPYCNDKLSCDQAAAYVCTDLDTPDQSLDTAAFGTWSIKYSAKKSKQLLKDDGDAKWLPNF